HVGHLAGRSLVKSCRRPVAHLVLEGRRRLYGVWVHAKDTDLLLFVILKMLEYSSLTEVPLALRESQRAVAEFEWLLSGGTLSRTEILLDRWFPQIDRALFQRATAALMPGGSLVVRCLSGVMMVWRLRDCLQQR